MFWRARPHRVAKIWPPGFPGSIERDSFGLANGRCIGMLNDTFQVLADGGGTLPLRRRDWMPAIFVRSVRPPADLEPSF